MKSNHFVIFAFLLFSCIASCSSEDATEFIQPSASHVVIDPEGGKAEITFQSGYWDIVGIIDKSSGQDVYGDIYMDDEKYSDYDCKLQLIGRGKMEGSLNGVGFCIVREETDLLEIIFNENTKNSDLCLAIQLQSRNELKEILVSQKANAGYEFVRIDYLLEKDDWANSQWGETWGMTVPVSWNPYRVWPFFNVYVISNFDSENKSAFRWLGSDSIKVPAPVGVEEGQILFDDMSAVYVDDPVKSPSLFKEEWVDLNIYEGHNKFFILMEKMELHLSYILTMKNKSTGSLKTVKGKYTSSFPTGEYRILWPKDKG